MTSSTSPQDLARALCSAFGWSDAELSILDEGENTIWRANLRSGPVAVRVYRPGRRTLPQIEAEWAWAEALGQHLVTPQPVAGPAPIAETWAVAMNWIEGRPLDLSDRGDVALLGRLAGAVWRAAREVEAAVPPDWTGHRRPLAAPEALLDRAEPIVFEAPFVSPAQRDRFRSLVAQVRRALRTVDLGPPVWVHADLHAHNVLASEGVAAVLDLDDSVRGPRAFEWATPRTHLRAHTDFAATWPVFADAAAVPMHEDEVRLATAVHLIDTMAEFPSHLDVIPDPEATVGRYLGYLEAEL